MQPADEPIKLREIWPPGTVIKGDYVIENKLGSGGFGTAYLARHRFLGTYHVIKRLHEQYASDAAYVRKFVNEGRAIRRLKACPHIVEIEHMTQSEDGHLILVMEHLSGGDLAGLIGSRWLTVQEVIDYSTQIVAALEAAHQAGLVHRDVKPQNLLFSQDSTGRPLLKLIDFGIAADHMGQQQTSIMRGGSIGFAAPEQWVKSGKDLDGRADLYGLGATMYRMLTGRMPYPNAVDIGGWIHDVRQGPPIPPIELRPDVPPALSSLIQEMLSPQPEMRPPDATSVLARLAAMQHPGGAHSWMASSSMERRIEEVIAPPTSPPPTPEPVPSAQAPPIAPPPQPPSQPSSNARSLLWMAVGAGGVGAVVFAALTLLPKTEPAAKQPARTVQAPTDPPPKQPEAKVDEVRAPVTKAKLPVAVATKPNPPREPPSKPAPNYAAMGDKARESGDLRLALQNYRALGDAKRLDALQRAVEGDTEERSIAMIDQGHYADALKLTEGWLREFPGSQRLERLRARITRARDSQ